MTETIVKRTQRCENCRWFDGDKETAGPCRRYPPPPPIPAFMFLDTRGEELPVVESRSSTRVMAMSTT